MKFRFLMLPAIVAMSLASGISVQAALAQSGNETAPTIAIGTGNGPPVQTGSKTPQPAQISTSNQTIKFKNVALLVNPEYDDFLKLGTPSLLVMLEGTLDGVQAPVQVKFLVPTEAAMYSAGSKDALGEYTGGPPDRAASSIPGWDEVSYILTQQTFRVEYYDAIITGQTDKTVSYDFRTISPISNMRVDIQQPRNSSRFAVTNQGKTGTAGIDEERYNISSYYFNNVTADAPVHFDISYSKGGSKTGFIIGLIIVVIVGGGLVLWAVKSRQRRYVTVRHNPGKQRKNYSRQRSSEKQSNRFCTKCGEQAGESAQFCPSCGSKLRDAA